MKKYNDNISKKTIIIGIIICLYSLSMIFISMYILLFAI